MNERATVQPDTCKEAVQLLRAEVEYLSRRVAALAGREHERDMLDRLITGGTIPALRVVVPGG